MIRSIFIIGWFLIPFLAEAQTLKRMLKTLEKKDYEQLDELLMKRYEKDSLNPDAFYANALLFLESAYPENIDSAYRYINAASADWELIEPREQEKLVKNGLSRDEIDLRIQEIEEMGFRRSRDLNTVEEYQYFIDFFTGAKQVSEAMSRRDDLAFNIAKEENTFESYSYFLNTYPEARQVKEARELYEIRLYQEKTKKNDLKSYQSFLAEYPESPFRRQAEKEVFEIMTLPNTPKSYSNFFQQVPHRFYTRKTLNYWYYSSLAHGESMMKGITNVTSSLMDSLRNASLLSDDFLIPFFDISKYGFMDETGETAIERTYDRISPDYICYGLKEDVILYPTGEDFALIGRNGKEIISGLDGSLIDYGYGIMGSGIDGKSILFHKGGHIILKGEWEEVKIFGNTLLAVRRMDDWNLYSFAGRSLSEDGFESVDELASLFFIKKAGRWAVFRKGQLRGEGKGKLPVLNFVYDDLELEEDHAIVFIKERMYLLDTLGIKVLDEGYKNIQRRFDRWIFESENTFDVAFDQSYGSVGPFEEVIFNEKFILGRREQRWSYLSPEDTMAFVLKNPRFFGTQFMIAERNDSLMLFYHPDSIPISVGDDLPELLSHTGNDLGESITEYVLLEKRNRRKLISSTGRIIEMGSRYESFQLQGKEYIVVKDKRGRKGVLDLKGKSLLKPAYEGIGNYEEGYVALLQGGKFGLFGGNDLVLIRPNYDMTPEPMGSKLLKVKKKGNFGLINHKEQIVLDFKFDDIRFWNDSVFWIKKDFRWSLINIRSEEIIIDDVKDFKPLRAKDELLYKILTGTGYGVISNSRGVIVPSSYSDLAYFENDGNYTYFCEKNIEEAQFYVLIYIDHHGNIIKKQAFEKENYEMIYCDED